MATSDGLSTWARARDPNRAKAHLRLEQLPESETGKGKAVPFPYLDRSAYKSKHSNREINKAISKAPIRSVPLDQLHAIQHSVKVHRVAEYIDHPHIIPKGTKSPKHGGLVDYPIVIKQDDHLYLHDGHHRCTAALLMGKKTIDARFVDFDLPSLAR